MLRGKIEGPATCDEGPSAPVTRTATSSRCIGLEGDPLRALTDFLDDSGNTRLALTSATHWFTLGNLGRNRFGGLAGGCANKTGGDSLWD
jgi:hypothetical protein